jgi:hypothetical protein
MKKSLLILIIGLGGCGSPQILSREKTIRDSVVVREVEKQVLIPAFTGSSNSINIDSLSRLLKSGVSKEIIERTLIREDPETKLKVGILIDSLGNMSAVCEGQEQLISVMIEEREVFRKEIERIIQKQSKTQEFFNNYFNSIKWAVALAGLAIVFGFYLLIRK